MNDQNHSIDDAIRSGVEPVEFPAERVRGRIQKTVASGDGKSGAQRRRTLRHAGRAVGALAAALALFFLGAQYGRHTAAPAIPAEISLSDLSNRSLPLAIQGTGSQYLATLTRLTHDAEPLGDSERRFAREVALTSLHAALAELARASGENSQLHLAERLLRTHREQLQGRTGAAASPETGA